MAGNEKELEERLRDVGNRLESPPASVDELLRLLDQTETFLSRVDQSPSQSMSNALRPVMTALVAKELLEHSDIDVKVSVASCISEVTRITAPDAPYDDDLMKDVFQRIVEAFENLNDTSSCSYQKRVSILETAAKVRSCVVMLDLECDDLILDMFRHFLKIVSSRNSENVLSSMETIMTLVIEESEDISPELASCLLHSVKKDREDEFPVSFKLGEKVIINCAVKLKPTIMQLVASTPLDMYSKIVTSVFLGRSDIVEQSGVNASEKDMANDGKLSERTVSDELPQGSAHLDQVGQCPEVRTSPKKSSAMMVSDGNFAVSNGVSTADKTPKEKPGRSRCSGQFKSSKAAKQDDSDNMESVAFRSDMPDPSTKTKGRNKANASGQLTKTVDHSKDDSEKVLAVSGRRKGRGKGTGSAHADGPSGSQVGSSSLDLNKKNETEDPSGVGNGDLDVVSGHVDTRSDPARPKRGCRPGSKSSTRRDADNIVVDQRLSRGAKRIEGISGSQGQSSKKDFDGTSDSEGKSPRRFAKDNVKLLSETVGTVTSDSQPKFQRLADKTDPTGKVAEGSQSKKQQTSSSKPQKEEAHSDGDDAADVRLKEMVSPKSAIKTLGKGKRNQGESGGSKRKRGQGTERIPSSQQHKRRNCDDKSIVSSRIEVWWPDDKVFYNGVIESFDPVSKKHKIVYDDGDIEILLLKNENWNFIGSESKVDAGQEKDISSPVAAVEMLKSRKDKTSLGEAAEIGAPKSGKELNSTSENLRKPKGRPKGGRPGLTTSYGDNPEGGSNWKEKAVGKIEVTPISRGNNSRDDGSKTGANLKDTASKSDSLSKEDPPKADRKHGDDTKSISKSRDIVLSARKNAGEGTPRGGRKSKGMATPKTSEKPKSNASSEKGKLKVQKSATLRKVDAGSARALEPGSSSGKKRRRKGLS